MPETPATRPPSSPPQGLSHSPSIFAYQTRILNRPSSVRNRNTPTTLLASPEKGGADSPPSTPIRTNVSKMLNTVDVLSRGQRANRSVDLVKTQWEARSTDGDFGPSYTPRSRNIPAASALSTVSNSPPIETPSMPNPDTIAKGASPGTPFRPRPASISSTASILTPHSTGNSSLASGRSHAVEDTLAQARANALKRLEARRKAKGETASPAIESSPFGHVFEPSTVTPTKSTADTSNDLTPTSRPFHRARFTPPSSAPAPRYVPSGLSATTPVSTESSGKYGSLSQGDRRRLGRHLPRIASGEGGWDEQPPPTRRVPSTLGRDSVVLPSSLGDTSSSTPSETKVLGPSTFDNVQSVPSTPSTKRRSYLLHTPKDSSNSLMPRPEVAGEEMKGLMSAVGGLPARGSTRDDGEGVTGMSNRLRLSRATLPPSGSSRTLAPAPLPSRRLIQANWMDRQRHALAAYEYLCHVGEAQQWIEGCLEEETGFGVTEMEEGLRDGVVLAKLARVFQGEAVVKKIWVNTKHRYKQTDNIDAFMKFVRTVGMPSTFVFDPIDLYEKKNIPKVIFCIHVLSHLLSRQGLAERIGNLVGQFEFTDEQLAKTQKGLQGVAMPNFGEARNTLAKEASWEPEEPEETEDERRDRELLECQDSIGSLQRHLRGRLARMRVSRIYARLDLARPTIIRFQARSRGAMCRNRLIEERDQQELLHDWATIVQAAARRHVATRQRVQRIDGVRAVEQSVFGVQSQIRGVLARNRRAMTYNVLDKSGRSFVALQAACSGYLARQHCNEFRHTVDQSQSAIIAMQARLRGYLHREKEANYLETLEGGEDIYVAVQSHARGVLVRRKMRAHEQKLDDASDYIVTIQATARGVLARQKKRKYVQHVQASLPALASLQAVVRARLAQQSHHNMQKSLAKVEVAGSVGGLQAFLRTRLAKRQTTEQKKKLEFVQPDVIGFQAVARGYLARQEYREWKEYLQDPLTQGALVFLQSLIRGFLARRRLWIRTSYIHRNVDKVIKVQALWRGRTERAMYDRLLTGVDVDVPTIQNYMHLLDDTDADYQRQIRTETLRREVVRLIRENQSLETEVKELDTKIALILKNKMTFEELARAKHRSRDQGHTDEGRWKDHTGRDPFTDHAHLDRASQRKLELFEHLFFTLQTKGEYLSRLLFTLSDNEETEQERRLVETVMLILFGYGHERREEYLFHKILQLSVHEEILRSRSIGDLAQARFTITSVATQYIKPTVTPYLQRLLHEHIIRVVDAPDLDLTTDPADIYHRSINEEESQTGAASQRPRNLDGNKVLETDETSRALYIQHLQELRYLTKDLLAAVFRSAQGLPYTVRLLAREALLALRVKYPEAQDEVLMPIVARTVILPFILPAIVAPELYGMAPDGVGAVERRNLAALASLVSHVCTQDFVSMTDHFVRTPLKEYIRAEGQPFRDWIMDVASIEPLETYFQADELLENTVEAKPIMITRTEIYGMLSILMQNVLLIAPGKQKDPMTAVLDELEGPPIDYDRSKTPVCLRLTNRLAELQATGPEALQKEDWVQAKRHILAVLRVQTGKTLFDVLVTQPSDIDEQVWVELVYRDMAREEAKRRQGELPQTPVEAEYQIESIRSLPFGEVKSRAIEFCMKLERTGRLNRDDAFAGLLVSIASDIRQKHHLRKMQRQNAVAMERAHEDMERKQIGFEEQIKSYHQFIDSSMASLQKGKKKATFLSKQYFHQRAEAKSGRKAQFGTYKYTAADLYSRGILLGINQLSPNVFSEVNVVIASNEVGVFSLEMTSAAIPSPHPNSGGGAIMGREEVRMEDLLQAQFENELNLLLFDGMATFSINMLIHQINKKFYSS